MPRVSRNTCSDCSVVFSTLTELKNHKREVHEPANKKWSCTWPGCDFFTLTSKRNLEVHVMAHTGEKRYHCPDTKILSTTAPASRVPCDYRTHDPSSLTKHRKAVHGYIPQPDRSHPRKTAPKAASQPDENVPRKPRHCRRPAPVFLPSMTGAPLGPRFESADHSSTAVSPLDEGEECMMMNVGCPPAPLSLPPVDDVPPVLPWYLTVADVPLAPVSLSTTTGVPPEFRCLSTRDHGENCKPTKVNWCAEHGYTFTKAVLIGTDDEEGEDVLYDPTLRTEWMVKYERVWESVYEAHD